MSKAGKPCSTPKDIVNERLPEFLPDIENMIVFAHTKDGDCRVLASGKTDIDTWMGHIKVFVDKHNRGRYNEAYFNDILHKIKIKVEQDRRYALKLTMFCACSGIMTGIIISVMKHLVFG
ncbi:MAG: hypothetical protein P8168_05515 [Deltaproteobacteria bacterium]|jgi:hypothetical protein